MSVSGDPRERDDALDDVKRVNKFKEHSVSVSEVVIYDPSNKKAWLQGKPVTVQK